MENQNNQENFNTENTSFYDQSDAKFNEALKNKDVGKERLAKGVTTDDEESAGSVDYSENLMDDGSPEAQVRATEDASLQDDSYSFDEDNTDNEEYHDAFGGDFDYDNDDDFIQ